MKHAEMKKSIIRQSIYIHLIAVSEKIADFAIPLDIGALRWAWVLVSVHPLLQRLHRLAHVKHVVSADKTVEDIIGIRTIMQEAFDSRRVLFPFPHPSKSDVNQSLHFFTSQGQGSGARSEAEHPFEPFVMLFTFKILTIHLSKDSCLKEVRTLSWIN